MTSNHNTQENETMATVDQQPVAYVPKEQCPHIECCKHATCDHDEDWQREGFAEQVISFGIPLTQFEGRTLRKSIGIGNGGPYMSIEMVAHEVEGGYVFTANIVGSTAAAEGEQYSSTPEEAVIALMRSIQDNPISWGGRGPDFTARVIDSATVSTYEDYADTPEEAVIALVEYIQQHPMPWCCHKSS